jgi:LAO/AO transport system kinase
MARASLEAVDVLDAAGFDVVVIETVGVGQAEVEIARAAHTVVVVSAPGLGDDIQAIKAGILEIADVHVVSKCDRSDANRTISDLKNMLVMGMSPVWQRAAGTRLWCPPVRPRAKASKQLIDCAAQATAPTCAKAMRGQRAHAAHCRVPHAQDGAKTCCISVSCNRARARCRTCRARLAERRISPYQAAEQLLDGINLEDKR